MVDVVNPPQDLPSGDHHLPCRDVCEACPIHHSEAAIIDEANESSEGIRNPGPMKITANLMRKIFSDGEDDRDGIFKFLCWSYDQIVYQVSEQYFCTS